MESDSSHYIVYLGGFIAGVVVLRCIWCSRIVGVVVVAGAVVVLMTSIVLTSVPIVELLIMIDVVRRDVVVNGEKRCCARTRWLIASAITATASVSDLLVVLLSFRFTSIVVLV